MTQSPQPPQMPPPEPLDEAERAIARALRNLPSGSPPPELDARILGAARRAVHLAPPRKREGRRWLVGFGTAATALFALGVMLKTHGPSQDPIYAPPAETTAADAARAPVNSPSPQSPAQSMPAANSVNQSAAADAAAATTIEPPPPPPQVTQSARQQKDMAAQPREETLEDHSSEAAKTAPQAFPAAPPKSQYGPPPPPPPPPVILDEPTPMSVPAPSAPAMAATPAPPAPAADERAERKAETSDTARRDAQAGGMAAQAPASLAGTIGRTEQDQAASKQAANSASDNGLLKEKSLDKVTVTGSRVKRADAVLPAPSNDAGLNPPEWIERIRERVRDGDHAGAVASLRALVAAHPDVAIPDDLQPLLR